MTFFDFLNFNYSLESPQNATKLFFE